ncbi:hypothetical protein Nizo2264_1188 [Lactiplantibacillus plantarum]|nr:hypothetical protein Nizo2264_1188 [Lactiplantibacillus plantarum]
MFNVSDFSWPSHRSWITDANKYQFAVAQFGGLTICRFLNLFRRGDDIPGDNYTN